MIQGGWFEFNTIYSIGGEEGEAAVSQVILASHNPYTYWSILGGVHRGGGGQCALHIH